MHLDITKLIGLNFLRDIVIVYDEGHFNKDLKNIKITMDVFLESLGRILNKNYYCVTNAYGCCELATID